MAKLQTVGSTAGKETIYVDVDDEITAIIDKVSGAKGKVVALVLPKRCQALQSVVNMKLLKRTADNAKKNLVLVTTEPSLMPLANNVGLYVASSPTSKPAVPEVIDDVEEPSLKVVDGSTNMDTADDSDFDPKSEGGKTIGELDKTGKKPADDDSTIDMSEEADELPLTAAAAKAATVKPKKNKKLSVPNFDSFKKRIALGVVGVIVLVVAYIFAEIILPAATVTISTNSSTVPTNLTLSLDTTARKLDTSDNTVPATAQTQTKAATQTVNATGQKNNGQKASGTVTVTNCSSSDTTISVGTSFSASGHTFIAQSSVPVSDSNFSSPGSGSKCKNDGKANVPVTALKGGADYNLAAASYTISGSPQGLSAQGSQMSGGTDDITTIVQQSDIDGAVSKISSGSTQSVKQSLTSSLEAKGLVAVEATFIAGDPQLSNSAQVGDQVPQVTVTASTTYTMLGVQKSDIETLVHNNVDGQLEKGVQVVLDDGVDNATFTENTQGNATSATVGMNVKSEVGPQIDTDSLKKQIAGMKSGDVKSTIKQIPGVTNVDVKYSPFWVNTIPKKAAKVTITTVKAGS